ncbi:Signal transduction histidine kinase [Pseudobutyrivibrio sp. YE44]|uniref:sensor histidine kinase n=1 Tax=Pseudobutyrivibrio sp. YE44 TaxID=1520802 RepID=UPI00088C080B|nr:histidine kinase [Pseudobutyrivibrio sp. YE44]SDB20469.1 Signal transduction histidine kinase [Pseudobutyrivibrio sp. YE44]
MLYDVIIRFLAATGLTLLINANGITTGSVVMSICVFLFLEIDVLISNKLISRLFSAISFLATASYIFSRKPASLAFYLCLVFLLACFYYLSVFFYEKMTEYKFQLHRTRDDSIELESVLKDKNRRLLEEQDQQVRLATLSERNRIAREIHDNVGHLLSRAILLLGAINTVNKDENLEPQLKMLADTLDESMAKMRSSVHDLHDDSIDLKKNFEDIIGELSSFNVNTELDLDGNLPKNVQLTLIGILKEAVTNIVKHSNGDSVTIILHQNYSFCTLSIYDNGTITQETKLKIGTENIDGIGLNNIKQRALSLGGDAYFYTNDGFTVFARLPL